MKTLLMIILLSLSVNVTAGQIPSWMQPMANSGFDCRYKYCKHMRSCSEAYYKFTECGMKRYDRDKDGVPCENVCGRNISQMQRRLQKGR